MDRKGFLKPPSQKKKKKHIENKQVINFDCIQIQNPCLSMETFKENKEAIREIIFVNDYKRQWTNTSITYKELQINKNKSSKPIEK